MSRTFDVFLSGFCVDVPDGTDDHTDAGLQVIRAAAIKRLAEMLRDPWSHLEFEIEDCGD